MSAPTFPEILPSVLEDFRPGLALRSASEKLGPLADLAGTWIGTGFNLIALPGYSHKPDAEFFLMLNTTVEILEFEPIGAQVPNRGSFKVDEPGGQEDIDIYGLRYLQRVADGKNHQPLHIEPGFWLHVPATEWPKCSASVVRQGVIPHGNSLLAVGNYTESQGPPDIRDIDSFPTKHSGDFNDPSGYLRPYTDPSGGFDKELIKNPNLALVQASLDQEITQTVTLEVSTKNATEPSEDPACGNGGIANIPFLIKNANVTKFDAIFWIETVRNPDDTTFLQLQYTQTAILDFLDIDWPHISVATLIKQ